MAPPVPTPTRCSSRSGRAGPGQLASRVPAGARRPAMIRCSAGRGRTARAAAGRQPARTRTGLRCCTGRRCTAPARPPDRRPLAWAPGPGRVVPGRPAQVLARARTGQGPAVRPRTGPARSRLAPAQVPLARIRAGRTAMVAPGHRDPALAGVPVRHRASQDRAGRPIAARPRTGRARPDPGQAARLPAGQVPTPGRAGTPMPARSAPLPVATRKPAPPAAAVPAGLVPVRGSSVPDIPVPADSPGTPVPDTRAARDTQVLAARRPDLPGRPDPGRVRTRTVPAAAGRRTLRRAGRAGAPGAAGPGAADPGESAAGEGPPGGAADGQRPASRPGDAARAGRSPRSRTLPACLNVAGIQAGGACRAPAVRAAARAACPRGGAVRVPCRSRSPGSRDPPGRRRLPGKSPAGKRPVPRRQRRSLGPACLGQARCPDDSPGTSWKHRAALATPKSSVGRSRPLDRADA
jgi:syndecan 1